MSLKKQAVAGMVWTFTQQIGTQLIGFAVSLILARLLEPGDFGVIALFGVLLGIGGVFISSGLATSLIRSQDVDHRDYSTVFFFNLGVSVAVYAVLYFTAPWVALFYKLPLLTPVIRMYSITLVIGALTTVQQTILTKQMDFKRQLYISMPSLVLGGIAGIILAYFHYGVWALVYMAIIQSLISCVFFWFLSPWKPSLVFHRQKFIDHFSFGYKMALSGLLDIIFTNIYTIIIGKIYNPTQLGFYNRADSLKQLPVSNLAGALNKVTFPLFAKIQDDDSQLRFVYRKIMRLVIFIIAPVLTIMVVVAEPLFRFLFTDKWLPAVPYFRVLSVAGLLYPIHAYNLHILQIKGRSDLFLRLEIIKKVLLVVVISISVNFGMLGLVWGQAASSFIALFINMHYTGKFLHYHAWDQFKDLLPAIFISIIAGFVIFVTDLYGMRNTSDWIRILTDSGIGLGLYLGLACLLKRDELTEIKMIILKR